MTERPIVEVENLEKRFGAVRALDGVSVAIAPGQVVGLIGANGAGKSSLVKAIAGVARPDAGAIRIDGEAMALNSPREALAAGIALDPQELTLVQTQSIAENLFVGALPTRSLGMVDRPELLRRASELLTKVGLGHRDPRDSAGDLTPVEARLVSIASSLSKSPRILILDEPSAALPVETARRLEPIIRGLAARGNAVIYISHRLHEVREYCDRVIAMRDGRLAGELHGEEITEPRMIELVGGRALTEEPPASTSDEFATDVLVRTRALTGNRVQGFDLDVRAGEVLGIGGLYGSGRSELLRLIGGVQTPTDGSVEVAGAAGPRSCVEARKRGIGYLAEGRRQMLFPAMSVRQNGTMAILDRLNRLVLRAGRERALMSDMASEVSLKGQLDAPVATLSGGNQQKVCLARWLLRDVSILVLDEPTVGIDVHARAEIHRLLRDLAAQGRTIIVASAEPEELALLCDRVVVLAEGRLNRELHAPFDADSVVAASYASAG